MNWTCAARRNEQRHIRNYQSEYDRIRLHLEGSAAPRINDHRFKQEDAQNVAVHARDLGNEVHQGLAAMKMTTISWEIYALNYKSLKPAR